MWPLVRPVCCLFASCLWPDKQTGQTDSLSLKRSRRNKLEAPFVPLVCPSSRPLSRPPFRAVCVPEVVLCSNSLQQLFALLGLFAATLCTLRALFRPLQARHSSTERQISAPTLRGGNNWAAREAQFGRSAAASSVIFGQLGCSRDLRLLEGAAQAATGHWRRPAVVQPSRTG